MHPLTPLTTYPINPPFTSPLTLTPTPTPTDPNSPPSPPSHPLSPLPFPPHLLLSPSQPPLTLHPQVDPRRLRRPPSDRVLPGRRPGGSDGRQRVPMDKVGMGVARDNTTILLYHNNTKLLYHIISPTPPPTPLTLCYPLALPTIPLSVVPHSDPRSPLYSPLTLPPSSHLFPLSLTSPHSDVIFLKTTTARAVVIPVNAAATA